jgi:hypothetical protein
MTVGQLKTLLSAFDDNQEVTIEGDPIEDVYDDTDVATGDTYVVISFDSGE